MELQLGLVAAAIATLMASMVHADEAAMKAVQQCAKDSNIKLEALMKACDEDLSAMPGFKCFTKCVQKTLGIVSINTRCPICPVTRKRKIDDSGKWSPEHATKFVAEEDKDVALKVATECAKEVDNADLCEKAAAANECMRKKNPEMYKRSCVALLAKVMT